MSERRPVLLTVSGSIPLDLDEEVEIGLRPRTDYRAMAERMGADVIDFPGALAHCGRLGRLMHRVGGRGALLGWYAFRHRRGYQAILTDGEQVGIPLALLTKVFGRGGSRHVMIAHVLSVPKKARVMRWTRIARQIDRYIVYAGCQADFIRTDLSVDQRCVVLMPFMVDTRFFDPAKVDVPRRRMICSAGLERRDYGTMIEAVDGLQVDVVIAAASPWSKWADSSANRRPPANLEVERLNLSELRQLYAVCDFVVMPLLDVDFQAGITTILEAMSMERAVICTRTAGQTDTIVEGVTGRYVPPGDAVALRAAIDELLADPEEAGRLGRNGRQWAQERADVEVYADAVAAVVRDVVEAS